jgi:hypothetical protein
LRFCIAATTSKVSLLALVGISSFATPISKRYVCAAWEEGMPTTFTLEIQSYNATLPALW